MPHDYVEENAMMRLQFQLLLVTSWMVSAACLFAAEPVPAPAPDAIPLLSITTGWLGNSLLCGGQADWKNKSQTFLQRYTSDMAVTQSRSR